MLNINVLIIEDTPMARMAAKVLLSKYTNQISLAKSGEEAVEMCQKIKFDCIFVDIGLPGIDGVETAKQIREIPLQKNAQLIALTANENANLQKQCFSVGMKAFINKPIDEDKIKSLFATS